MNFIAKFNGQPPAPQDQVILFSDCDTGADRTQAPTTLTLVTTQSWLKAALLNPTTVRVSVNQQGLNAGDYNGVVQVRIPDAETCEVGKLFSIPVVLTVQKGKIKFQ